MTSTTLPLDTATDSGLWSLLPPVAAVGAALMGGVFFTFSGFVMPALSRLPAAAAAAAMQSVNVTAVRPPLMVALFGTGALCVVAVVRAATSWGSAASIWLVAGAALYLLGVVGMTALVHVPMNDHLAGLGSTTAAADYWSATYLPRWTAWNHVRAAAGVASAAAFLLAWRAR